MHCSNKAMSVRKEKLKRQRTYRATKNAYGAGVFFNEDKDRYVKYSCNNKGLRQALNRKARRKMNRSISEETSREPDGHYRKMEDYWWNLL